MTDRKSRESVRIGRYFLGLLYFVLVGQSSACTLTGAALGSGVTHATAGPSQVYPVSVPWRDSDVIQSGDWVRLHLKGGQTIEGHYLGVEAPAPGRPDLSVVLSDRAGGRPATPSPTMATLVSSGLSHVPASQVVRVEVEALPHGWLIGGGIGLALDIAFVVVASSNFQDFPF